MLTALQGRFTKNKFESSETPTRTGTVTVSCSIYCRSNDGRTKSSDIGEISAVKVRLGVGWQTVECAFSVIVPEH